MTLLIACLLIYNFDMAPWWYAVAAIIWWFQTYLVLHFAKGMLFKQPS